MCRAIVPSRFSLKLTGKALQYKYGIQTYFIHTNETARRKYDLQFSKLCQIIQLLMLAQ